MEEHQEGMVEVVSVRGEAVRNSVENNPNRWGLDLGNVELGRVLGLRGVYCNK